ncbi:MAG: response regulator [Candidatus Eremiobacteraeota bacterium]|nr:response regulator [Candidatus Eremiobacteraeota bacterium]MCW5870178.1 response regulator [Candidatus Eremiobacteraeota bacterium]
MLHQFLEELGHEVMLSNQTEDLDGLEDQDLIILDESMALRCKDSLGKLKGRRHLLPVLLVTRHSSPGAVACLRQGFIDDILYMPTSKPELTSRLNVLLRLSTQSRTALQKFERLFEDASWGIAILHPEEFYIEAANQAFARMLEVSSVDLTRRDFRSLVAPGALAQLDRDLSRLRQKHSFIFQTELRKDRAFPVEIDATVYRDISGSPLYIATYVRDITERLQASRAKSHFLANINHELRTPLHGVLAPLSLLSNTALSAEQRDQVRLIQQSADALFRLVGDILDFTTLESGELKLERLPVSLPKFAESVLEDMQAQAKGKGLALSLSLKQSPRDDLLLDPVRLRQLLQHLLSNAIKFTQEGSIEVSFDFLSSQQLLRCEVRDDGIGIHPQRQESIFEFFTQADASTTRRFEGIGLGLSLCVQLVRLMGGRLDLKSQLGRGSTFFFEIPAEAVRNEPQSPEGRGVQSKRSLNVLVVEDNPVNQHVMRLMLAELGHRTEVASEGREGLHRYEQESFDLILMDLQMPDLSGFDVARSIRGHERASGRPRTPIVAVTARALADGREECLKAGMDEYLTKPVSLNELRTLLGQLASASA